jgi:cytochrome c553
MMLRSRWLGKLFILCLACLSGEPPVGLSTEPKATEFFENQVRPLLAARCLDCHGREKQQASLRLDTKMGILSGGENGAAVIAGKVDESLLIQAVRREGLEMPPDEPLSAEEIAILERWVRDGAHWPEDASDSAAPIALGDQAAIGEQSRSHWAFLPLVKPAIPAIRRQGDIHPIDAFIEAKLEELGLEAVPTADRPTLLRRASYDVTGLPPSSKAIAEFEADGETEAFQRQTRQMLGSKEFGQRWGRYWLDVARYADTRDWQAQTDERYPFAYTYRDYVIKAINDDKPYDQFLREQIAADFLYDQADAPELAALGFLTVGPRFRNNNLEQLADRIDCVTRGVMGLTVACARCHDHKYDPVTIEDYYALYGIFDSTELTEDMPLIRQTRQISPEVKLEYEKARAAREQELEDYIVKLREKALGNVVAHPERYAAAVYELGISETIEMRAAISKHQVEDVAATALEDALRRIRRDRKLKSSPIYGPLLDGLAMEEAAFTDQAAAWRERWRGTPDIDPLVLQTLEERAPKTRQELLEAYLHLAARVMKEPSTLNQAEQHVREGMTTQDGLLVFARSAVISGHRLLGGGRKALGDLDKAIREVDAVHPGSPPRAMVVVEKAKPVTPYVMLRGEPTRRGEQVERRFLTFLEDGQPSAFSQGSGRLELANKLTDPRNPLTARVAVNRVWMRYVGRGLADSPDDFGLRSPPPSHPELLDWLAASFIENGWSMKWLHQLILDSDTYQRSSVFPEDWDAARMDPENRWFWRQNRRRLDFEATRDTMLAVSGELDRSLDGPSVKLSQEPFPLRRTVYAYVDRVNLDPMLKVFDFASPLASASLRSETTVPQHALFVMNHPFVVERAQIIADKVRPVEGSGQSIQRGLNTIFRRMLGRLPTPAERRFALAFVTTPISTEGLKRTNPWSYGVLTEGQHGIAEFTPLPHWTGQAYQGGPKLPDETYAHARLVAGGGHPGQPGVDTVRRFTVPVAGKATITGTIKHERDKGDGIIASVVIRRARAGSQPQMLGQWSVFDQAVELNTQAVSVEAGDLIDWVASCGKNPASDAFTWTGEVRLEFDDESSNRWASDKGFEPPAPAPLDGWEQLAQALMLTNEFMYVD